jgi:uncharacterized protein (DUF427 family)
MSNYPGPIVKANHVAPAPRRVRGFIGTTVVFDTTRALYVWEWPFYPQYYIPRADVRMELLVPEGERHNTPQGESQRYALHAAGVARPKAARLIVDSPLDRLRDTIRFTWESLESWFEEDEEVFVHPRNPYTRVDALRSTRRVRVELGGAVLADSPAPVLVFETGLPTRYYVDPLAVRFDLLTPSKTRTECPYKGRTNGYWSVARDGAVHADLAWMYSFPTRQLLPIAGLVAFLNEKVDIFIDDVQQERPVTHMG